MRAKIIAQLLSAAVILTPVTIVSTTVPAAAQASFNISFGYFYQNLAPHGTWFRHARWGDVWHPTDVPRDFQPYSRGHWEYTDNYGWLWLSDYDWGDITSHYGRWVYDPNDGWLWVPGYVWAPAWVVWHQGDGYVGWFPMPPDPGFLSGNESLSVSWNWNNGFGYDDWYGPQFASGLLPSFWVFVDDRHFTDRDVYRYQAPRNQIPQLITRTRNVTRYNIVDNHVVDRSINVNQIEQRTGRRIQPVPINQAIRGQAHITTVDAGRQIQQRERRQHGGNPNASARARVQRLPANAVNEQANANGVNQPGTQANQQNAQNNRPERGQRGLQGRAEQQQAQGRTNAQQQQRAEARQQQTDQRQAQDQARQQQAEQRQAQDQARQQQADQRQAQGQAREQQAEQRQAQGQARQQQADQRQAQDQARQQQAEQRQAQDQARQQQAGRNQAQDQARQQQAEQRQAQDQARQQQADQRQAQDQARQQQAEQRQAQDQARQQQADQRQAQDQARQQARGEQQAQRQAPEQQANNQQPEDRQGNQRQQDRRNRRDQQDQR